MCSFRNFFPRLFRYHWMALDNEEQQTINNARTYTLTVLECSRMIVQVKVDVNQLGETSEDCNSGNSTDLPPPRK